jgi:hypothetical protein
MFGSLWKGIKSFGQKLGLGKEIGSLGGLLNKGKSMLGKGMDFLRSAPVKGIVKSLSEYMPSVGDYYNKAKQYGSIASNLMSGGLGEKANRFIKNPPTIERSQKKNPFAQEPRAQPKQDDTSFMQNMFA